MPNDPSIIGMTLNIDKQVSNRRFSPRGSLLVSQDYCSGDRTNPFIHDRAILAAAISTMCFDREAPKVASVSASSVGIRWMLSP